MRQKMTFLILPVGLRCNLACSYCYHGVVSRETRCKGVMSDEILERIIRGSMPFAQDFDFVWHGGESLLAGMKHFSSAIRLQNMAFMTGAPFTGRIRNVIQSNLTLLDSKWMKLLSEKNFLLSTSIDGSRAAHDANRVHRNHSGTYDKVRSSIAAWRGMGHELGAVTLITKVNVDFPDETYVSLIESGITSFNFHYCAQDEAGSIGIVPDSAKTAKFLKRVFDLWFKDDNPDFPVRNFRNVLRVLGGGRPLDCTSLVDGCRGFMAINYNGDIYPCHRYVGRPGYKIGNILTDSLHEAYGKADSLYQSMGSLGPKCQRCEWLDACGNGCAFERLTTNGSFASTAPECEIKKDLFSHIRSKTGSFFNK